MPRWRNWQTHYLEVVAPARAWRFESSLGHQNKKWAYAHFLFWCIYTTKLERILAEISDADERPAARRSSTLRRQPRRNFPLQFFFCARPLKKIQKRKGKFLLSSAQKVSGRCGRATNARGHREVGGTLYFKTRELKMRSISLWRLSPVDIFTFARIVKTL